MNLLIWWLNQPETETLIEGDPAVLESLPSYIASELQSRYGRNGRGRLWIHGTLPNVPKVGVDPWPDTPLAKYLGQHAGGIVFHPDDLTHLKTLPGTITDLNLNVLGRS